MRVASVMDSLELFFRSSLKGKNPRVRLAEHISAVENIVGQLLMDEKEDTDDRDWVGESCSSEAAEAA